MKLIRRLFAVIAGFGLAVAAWGFIATAQLFNATVLEQAAATNGTYSDIARELPSLVSQVAPLSSAEQSALAPYFDADLVRQWAGTILPQLEHYYREGGTRPQLDLSAVSDRMAAAGIPVPDALSAKLDQPVTISTGRLDRTVSEGVRWSAHARLWGPIIAGVAILLGLLLARGHRWRWLATAFGWTVVWLLVLVGLISLVPQLVGSTVVNSAAGSLAVPLRHWIEAVIAPPRKQLIITAIFAVGLAIVAFTLQLVSGLGHHKDRHA